jgi:SSS family solute:Na+ symporter
MFTQDIALHYGNKGRQTNSVFLARSFIVGIVAFTYLLSLGNLAGVFDLAIWCFSGFTSLVPLVVAAIYWRRLTKSGAYASILTTAILWGYFFCDANFGANGKYAVMMPGGNPVLPVTVMFCGATLALVVVSLLTKPPSEKTLKRFFPEHSSTS